MKTLISRLRGRPITSLIGIVALLLAGGFGVAAWISKAHEPVKNTHEVVNLEGGYRFEAPNDWSTKPSGRTTTLTSPDGSTVIALGVGRTGSLPVAGTHFFQQVAGAYRDVKVIPPEYKSVGPRQALAYGGQGTNGQNTVIRFLAITVENNPTNYGITVFTAANSDSKTVLPQVNGVVDSFRTLPPR
ncbi:MAG TPA: hypothetical protein VIY28_06160 [Pseudonocardiaceae bacterium]